MNDPLLFETQTSRYELPLLFAGQSQKEFFVNEALLRADLLLHCLVEGEVQEPPLAPLAGQAWLVGSSAEGAFEGRTDQIAGWCSGGWRFIEPRDGLRVFDRSSNSFRLFSGAWRQPQAPAAPSGGEVVDSEARATLTSLLDILVQGGVVAGRREPLGD